MVLPLHDREDGYTIQNDGENDKEVAGKRGILLKTVEVVFLDGRGTVQVLKWIAVFVVLWNERLIFLLSSLRCIPTEDGSSTSLSDQVRGSSSNKHHSNKMMITILADPQLIDRQSYEHLNSLPAGISKLAYGIVRWAANTYVRKAFQAVVRTQGRAQSDAVIWLGDLLDGGRKGITANEDVQSYERHVSKFKSIFLECIPSIYLPGNHDVRIPLTHNAVFEGESFDSHQRWLQTWGTWYDSERKRYTWSKGQSMRNSRSSLHSTLGSRSDERITERSEVREESRGGIQRRIYQHKRAPIPPINVASTIEKVIMWPIGGPERILVISNEWKQTVNAKFPLHLNLKSDKPTHELILVDALHLAGMSPATSSIGGDFGEQEREQAWLQQHDLQPSDSIQVAPKWYTEGKLRFGETLDFVEDLRRTPEFQTDEKPIRVLFSHIPLHRPARTQCSTEKGVVVNSTKALVEIEDHGWHRESKSDSIEQGVDQYATYQNMLARPVSQWLLHRSEPHLVFSGDDHDHCHVRHEYDEGSKQSIADELTLKAFSMTGGVRRPGFARLVLSWDEELQKSNAIAMPCALPDQIQIWTKGYPIALMVLICTLLIDRRFRIGRPIDVWIRDRLVGFHSSSFSFSNLKKRRKNLNTNHLDTPMITTSSPSSSRFLVSPGNFEARARREIRRTNLLNRPVLIERKIFKEVRRMIILPLVIWLWLQLF